MLPMLTTKPYRIKAEFEWTSATSATLRYEEQFIEADRKGIGPTLALLPRVFDMVGDMHEHEVFHDDEKCIIGFTTKGHPQALAGYAMVEFLIQMFTHEDPTGDFWNIIDGMQRSFSSVHKDLWKDMPRQPPPYPMPLLVLCGKCSKAFSVSPTLNKDFVCPFCGHKSNVPTIMGVPTIGESMAALEKMGKPPEGAVKVAETIPESQP